MNLVDYHITKILSGPTKVEREWGAYWRVEVEYWDDGGSGQIMEISCMSEDTIRAVQVGTIGQH